VHRSVRQQKGGREGERERERERERETTNTHNKPDHFAKFQTCVHIYISLLHTSSQYFTHHHTEIKLTIKHRQGRCQNAQFIFARCNHGFETFTNAITHGRRHECAKMDHRIYCTGREFGEHMDERSIGCEG
jgi:hypothetical protein